MKKNYYALAYYLFTNVEDPHLEVRLHKELFRDMDVSCRIYLSENGINGQFSGAQQDAEAYMAWLKQRPGFEKVKFKIHHIEENIFPRVCVKYRKELVAMGGERVNTEEGAKHISPAEWAEKLDDGKCLVIDVRNNYESKIGHFEQAILPDITTFKEFPQYAEQLAKQYDHNTPVMMYCTGGIRCELYSVVLMKQGFKEVYQLDGGVIAYGQQMGNKHWKGKLFVFDDRMAIPIDDQQSHVEPIAHCTHCQTSCDTYYNCANADCNTLFICCEQCVQQQQGCCSHACTQAPRIRKFDQTRGNKPFRRKHLCACPIIEQSLV